MIKFLKPLWPHQLRAYEEATRQWEENQLLPAPLPRQEQVQSGYALFFEPRCGKTPTAIAVLRYLCTAQRKMLRTLIFCPPRVVPNWGAEIAMHSKFDPRNVILLQGDGKRRLDHFTMYGALGAHIFITNYETLLMDDLFEVFRKWKPEFIIFDESHRLKDMRAKRSKRAELLANPREKVGELKLIRNAPYKMILTGSPFLNSEMDFYQQFKILDGGNTFSYRAYDTGFRVPLSFRGFQVTYFIDKNIGMPAAKHFPDYRLKTLADGMDAKGEISKKIATKGMRIERKDCLILPPVEYVRVRVPMAKEQHRLYAEMKRGFITQYKNNPVVAKMALTKSLRLLQITSGFVKTDDGREIYLDEIPKQDALKELLSDLAPSGKCLVWSVFKENYRQIREACDALRLKYVEVHGEIGAKQQDLNVKAFQTDPAVRVFIGHPESGGEGINLVQAPYNIFYSRSHSLKHSIQASARNQSADSQHVKTVRYDIVAEGTLDELVADLVSKKEAMANEVYAELVLKNLLQDAK